MVPGTFTFKPHFNDLYQLSWKDVADSLGPENTSSTQHAFIELSHLFEQLTLIALIASIKYNQRGNTAKISILITITSGVSI